MNYKEVNGDLIKLALSGKFTAIAHGCNCYKTMGAGIAKQIAERFPNVFEADKATMLGA